MATAIVVARTGGPEVLELREQEVGAPGAGQARVKVHAAGVNFIDTYQRSGAYPRPVPFVLGLEGAGVVEEVGEGVTKLAVGARVAWAQAPGSYTTELIAPASVLVPVPDGVELDVAAASLLQGMTAHYLTHGVRQGRSGDVALVHAAAGGTGLLLVQMLARAGVRVIATCSSAEKAALVLGAGASDVIRYTEQDFVAEAKRLTAGRGVDVVYDSVGRDTFEGSLRALRTRGLCVLFGQASGAVPPLDPQRLSQGGSLFLTRPTLAHYAASREELELRAGAVFSAARDGTLRVRIGGRFPLADAAAAHRMLESRASTGKLLLECRGPFR
jgi:NADPH2:quinone reductase